MAEYIERSAVLQNKTTMTEYDEGGWGAPVSVVRVEDIEAIPDADVAPVVRCEDCKHQEDCMKQLVFWEQDHVLEQNVYQYHKLDFCSYGERRADNG